MKIHEEFNCVGYYGFGDGVFLQRRKEPLPVEGSQLPACSQCPRKGECWNKHRARVRTIAPDLMGAMDELVAIGLRGPGLVRAWQARIAEATGRDASSIAPPEINVLAGNITDGSMISAGMPPADRGAFTLRYPFES